VAEFWEANLILKVRAGSRAQGLETPGSDEDSRGVCVPEKRHLLGLSAFEQWESERGDHVVYALAKFARLALAGNPNILEVLWTDGESILHCDEFGERLRAGRALFLSRRAGQRFLGYAEEQETRLERHRRWIAEPPAGPPAPEGFGAQMVGGRARFPHADAQHAFDAAQKHWNHFQTWRAERNPARAELEARFGYDTKHALHLLRLLAMGVELLERRELLVRRPDAQWLRDVRAGSLRYEELQAEVVRRKQALRAAIECSTLPVEPDLEAAEALVIEITERFLAR
jgi:predicted nucleotidyltransferase